MKMSKLPYILQFVATIGVILLFLSLVIFNLFTWGKLREKLESSALLRDA